MLLFVMKSLKLFYVAVLVGQFVVNQNTELYQSIMMVLLFVVH